MRNSSWILVLSIPFCLGAAPSRTCTYTSGQIIEPDCVSENEDNIFSYLQAGVDTIRDNAVTSAAINNGTIANADISSSAAISLSKLESGTSAQLIVVSAGGVPTYNALSGDATISNAGALTIVSNAVALGTDTTGNYAATVADAGNTTITVTGSGSETAAITLDAIDVNCSNCIDGTDIALGGDTQGDVYYYDGTNVARLGVGTSGQFLKTQGAGLNPVWATGSTPVYRYATATWDRNGTTDSETIFTVTAGKVWIVLGVALNWTTTPSAGGMNNNTTFTVTMSDNSTFNLPVVSSGSTSTYAIFDLIWMAWQTNSVTNSTATTANWKNDTNAKWDSLNGLSFKSLSVANTNGIGQQAGTAYLLAMEY